MTFGEKLKNILMDKSISVSELSRISDIPKTTIYSIISRRSKAPRYDVVIKLANALNVKITDLYDNEELAKELKDTMQSYFGTNADVTINLVPPGTYSKAELPPPPEKINIINKAVENDGIFFGVDAEGSVFIRGEKFKKITCTLSDDELNELYKNIDTQIRMAVTKFILDYRIFWLFGMKPESTEQQKMNFRDTQPQQSSTDKPKMDTPTDD